jgi:ElaB/YqjD/DUF883 family membrane-anchored ribosome-binding protein
VVNSLRQLDSKIYLASAILRHLSPPDPMPQAVYRPGKHRVICLRIGSLSGWHTGCRQCPQPGKSARPTSTPETIMANPPSTTPDTTFPKTGATTPSSASPATPSAGGSGSRPAAAATADAAIDQAAAAERDVMRRVVQGAHEAVDRIADKSIPAVERLKDTYNDAADTLKQRADQAVDLTGEWTESLRTAVREHPLAAIGTALALGVILARLTSSSNDR